MQRVTMVRYTTKADRAAENESLARSVFAEVHEKAPRDVAYALFRSGNEFFHVFVNFTADESASVTELPSFLAFQKDIAERCEIPPQVNRVAAELLEAYGFLASRR